MEAQGNQQGFGARTVSGSPFFFWGGGGFFETVEQNNSSGTPLPNKGGLSFRALASGLGDFDRFYWVGWKTTRSGT